MSAQPWFPRLATWLWGQPVESGPVCLSARRIYILPTRQGLLFAAFLLAMLVGAINYGLSLGFGLVFLLAGVGLVAMVQTWANLRGLTVTAVGTTPAFAGEHARFHFLLSAPGTRPAITLRAREGAPVSSDVEGTAAVTLSLPALRRGWLVPGRITVATEWPLGLFRAWAYVTPELSALVYPRPAEEPAPAFAGAGSEAKGTPGHEEGREDFSGLRPFVPGDSPRQVAWKVAARGGPLVAKRFEAHDGHARVLDWAATPGDAETKASRLARAVLEAEREGLAYALRLPDRSLPPARGTAHREACLALLAVTGLPEPTHG